MSGSRTGIHVLHHCQPIWLVSTWLGEVGRQSLLGPLGFQIISNPRLRPKRRSERDRGEGDGVSHLCSMPHVCAMCAMHIEHSQVLLTEAGSRALDLDLNDLGWEGSTWGA